MKFKFGDEVTHMGRECIVLAVFRDVNPPEYLVEIDGERYRVLERSLCFTCAEDKIKESTLNIKVSVPSGYNVASIDFSDGKAVNVELDKIT